MPWEVDDQKPIPIQRPTEHRHVNVNPADNRSAPEFKCSIHAPKCFTESIHECSKFFTFQRKSSEFQQNYKRWLQSMIDDQTGNTYQDCVLFDKLSHSSQQTSIRSERTGRNENLNSNHDALVSDNKFDKNDDPMDKTVAETIYATCSMKANRHIPLILQEDIEGYVNMWQSKQGGPVFMRLKLQGLKKRLNNDKDSRNRRESNIIETRIPFNSSGAENSCLRGFHVHEFGNLTKGCQSTGLHFNPKRLLHGGPADIIRHIGDLGNIQCDANGTVDTEMIFPKISLIGEHSIIGRSLVIHSQKDDYGRFPSDVDSSSNGNSGPKVACCIIEKVNQLRMERPVVNYR
ncbi:Superoxide dismutase-like [Cu-Zn] [Leptotrombidium deliense]|uniref:Superoxide dismutase-like [Cu-Zn] n=1 Tax=Leptotrombidium deliense TaxID=299467 RepID=A0A443S6E7_9ACAR|nr:Superoxide dismutase-like [Cu-Zn] [Leptotrombidium deliense]